MRAMAVRPLTSDWDWQLRAACRGGDPELFFGTSGERGPRRAAREQAARRVCAGCPVVDDCLRHALDTPELDGVWGGLTESELAAVRAAARTIPA